MDRPDKFNFLPPEMTVGAGMLKIVRIVRALSIAFSAMLFLFLFVSAAFYIVTSLEVTRLLETNEQMKAEIKSLESTEQKAVLTKDRVGKIKLAQETSSMNETVSTMSQVLGNLQSGIDISEVLVDKKGVDLTIRFLKREQISDFLSTISRVTFFKTIVLNSLNFSSEIGYLADLRLTI